MKYRLVALVSVVMLLVSACAPLSKLAGSIGSGGKSQEYAYVFEANDNPINVDVKLDDTQSGEAVIPVDGGTLSVKGKDGTTFTLTIPNDALLNETTIRMIPVASLTGMPFGSGEALAVQLEPEGLFFNNFVTLTITPAQEIPIDQQIMFGYLGSGQDVILALPVVDSREIKLQILHFSGYGVTKGYLADVEPARQRIGGDAERRLQSAAAERLGRERQGKLLGEEDDKNIGNLLDDLFSQYEEEVVKPRIAAAGESCAAGQLAIQTVLAFERQKALLGYETGGMSDVIGLMDTVGMVCAKEEYELCKNDHVIDRMIPVWLGMERQSALLGGGGLEAIKLVKELTKKCLTFELRFSSQGVFDADGGGYDSSVESKVKVEFNPEGFKFEGSAPLVNTAFTFKAEGCSVTSNRGGSTFELIDFGYIPGDSTLDNPLPHVKDFTLAYYPGNTTESFTVNCEDQPPYTAPPSPMWTGIFLVTHESEMSQESGGFVLTDWDVTGGEYYAKKEWIKADAGEGLTEVGTFKLYHRPQ